MTRLAVLAATLFLASPAYASAQSVWAGAKAGLDRAAWSGDFGLSYNPFGTRAGVTAGVTLSVGLKEVLSVQVEALYTEKGATGPDGFRANMTYLEVPLLVKLALPLPALHIQPMAMAGLAPAWEISCRALAQPAYIPEAPPPAPIPMDCIGWRTERRDMGAVLAGGVEVPLGRVKVTAEIRRTTGRINVAQGYAPLSTYNNVWSFIVGMAVAVRR